MAREAAEEQQQQQAGYDRKGAGGKLTKSSSRSRVSSTPYARPPLAEKSKSGWFSKLLVNPASKLLHIPSIFSSSNSSSKQQDRDRDQNQPDQSLPELEEERSAFSTLISNNQNLEPDEPGASAKTTQPKFNSKGDDLGIAEIKHQLQQKRFSRDETEHLIDLLRSRTTDLPDADGKATALKLGASEVTLGHEDIRKPRKEDYGTLFDCKMTRSSSDHFQLKANDVSSSPVDIEKAFMESRASACPTGRLKNDKNSLDISTQLNFKPAAKSPVCWPGAIVQSDHGYFTPRRGSIPHHPRTPYSGALFSKSTSKLQVTAERSNHPSIGQSLHMFLGRNMTDRRTKSVLDDSSPRCHTCQKHFASTSEGAGPSSSIERTIEDGSSKGSFYKFQFADAAKEAPKSAVDATPVHPQSSLMARRILEHLDKSVPSPKEKLMEINLSRKRTPPKLGTPDVVSQEIPDAQKLSSFPPTTTSSSAVFKNPENRARPPTSTKPSEKLKLGNSFTFTFPSTPASFSEPPPTPTMASSPTASSRTLETNEGSVKSFNFISTNSSRLVFSFDSVVGASDFDVAAPSFKFGDEERGRLSFKPSGEDAICC